MPPAHLCHYTATTGDTRRSPRSEVSEDTLALVTPWCESGTHAMPAPFRGYSVRSTRLASGALAAQVLGRSGVVLASLVVAVTAEELSVEWTRLGLQRGADLWAPACFVLLEPGLLTDPSAASWLGDFERCLAWAEVGRRG